MGFRCGWPFVGLAGLAGLVLLGGPGGCGGGGGGSEIDRGLCPDGAVADLELCVSFGRLEQGLDESEVGGFLLDLGGAAEIGSGRSGPGLVFDGQDDSVSLPGFDFDGQQLTVEAWVRPATEQPKWATVVDYWTDSQGFWLGGSTAPGGWEFWSGLDTTGDSDGLVAGGWQHLAGVLDGEAGELVFYINGVEMDRRSGAAPFTAPPPLPLSIGARGDSSDFFQGTIDEVMVWSAVRTPAQICSDGGGQWDGDRCSYDQAVAEPPGPCEGVTCSGHGSCRIVDGQAACICDAGYHAEGLYCVEDVDACAGISATIDEWVDWYLSQLEAGLEAEMQAFVDGWEPGNAAWNPEAEAWTAAAILGLLHNAEEVYCLGALKAVQLDPENPVALANAATCMLELGYGTDARQFLDCSLSIAPDNAATMAGQAYHEYHYNGDVEAALAKYEQAAAADPANPAWSYQAIQLAIELDDAQRAAPLLANLPGPAQGAPNGWRGALPPDEPGQDGGYCCPCEPPTMYDSLSECTGSCSASLACFIGICAFTGECQAQQPPFAFQLKICIPPSGVQVCFTFDTNGNFGVQVGASVCNGFLGAGVGFTYNPWNEQVNVVLDVGTNNLPINSGVTFSYDPVSGQATASAGVGDSTGIFSGQVSQTVN